MKKTLKIFSFGLAISTFALNLSMNSAGEISLAAPVKAEATESTTGTKGWKSVEVACEVNGVIYATTNICQNGTQQDCTPGTCPPPPDTDN